MGTASAGYGIDRVHARGSWQWAPVGAHAERCPEGSFFCPGAAQDDVNEPPGSKPILLSSGSLAVMQTASKTAYRVEMDVTLASSPFEEVAFRAEIAQATTFQRRQ